ncbi:M43 family zinc metalloprotease [Fluviicola chungangensis]|uniref:T9SS type A sorting domain-containing protein n=1 Tax=Fluviicola chungangensis TaxID=2597671 RepID=A0A556N2M9_9FLAO|nr:M43 family zinc metalloprotease [Fluviicola chungangensis]TSJ46325.1 T9SS type A sorting domain-containing protein [Fluviicola chungangensis]
MKLKTTSFLFALLLSTSFGVNAQQTHTCRHVNPDTEALKNIKSLLAHSQKSTDLKIIPVVFHVLHQNGSENISQAQVWDELQNLNEDFQRMNADTTLVTAPFDTIKGKANFEFRLATIAPNGNPTDGIDRIFSPLTNVGDETAMINAWDSHKYVNIWVVRQTIPGVFGFTSNPLTSLNSCNQGIVILNESVGSIGTGNTSLRHILTHEMGQYFGLFHTCGNQDLGESCNYSDGIIDTPISKGNSFCNLSVNSCDDTDDAASFAYWGFDPRDNIENFMELSYCQRMFTNGQVDLMRSVVESPLYSRDQLWTPANLNATGTAGATPPVAEVAPNSNFSILSNNNNSNPFTYGMICAGDDVQFSTENGLTPFGTTFYSWSFPGGNPATSPLEDPIVTYANPGYYNVTLTATGPHGSTTTTRNAMIYVSGSWPEFTGPTVQDFNTSGNFWQSQNMQDDSGYFQHIANGGMQNTGCFLLGNHYEADTTEPCYLADARQINGSKDNLISPAFDLSTSTGITISFDYAYGSAAVPDSATEVLKVYYSRDCGETWVQKKMISDTALITAFAAQNSMYLPAQNQWKQVSFPFTTTSTDTKTRFKFEFIASNFSNNLYIDNFVIDGVLGISDSELSGISIFPNPSQKGGTIGISGLSGSKADLTIRDIQGKLVYQKELSGSDLQLNTDLKSGCYLIEVTQKGSKFLTRLIID